MRYACSGYGYGYNAANRMSDMSITGVVQAEYEYNALGQQVVRRLTVGGQTIHSVHDGDGNRIAEYEFDPVALTSTLLREYIWMNGQAVGVIEGGILYLVRSDHIGRPVFATNTLGIKVWEASYLPFGGVQTSTGDPTTLRFPGQWFQSEAGLHQNWMRDYDPTTGRYLQGDPLGLVDGASVYGYVRQNPGRYVDPTGLFCIPCLLPFAGGTAGTAGTAGATGTITSGAATGLGLGALITGIISPSTPGDGTSGQDAVRDATEEGTCDDDFDGECEKELDRNRAICRQLVSPSRKRACYAQASAVYAACTTNRPKPPFNYP